MKARPFMHVCLGLLALTAAFELGAHAARAQTSGFRIIGPGTVVVGDAVYGLHTASDPVGWRQFPDGNFDLPPVPPSTLVNYSSGVIAITDSGEGWGKVAGVWTDLGPIPTTAVTESSWGQVKARYR